MEERAITFSVITVTRNAAAHISRCLDSVAAQSFAAREHIVIDGASTDQTPALVKARGAGVVLVSEPDEGIYHAMNKGLARAKGDYVLFLGADDYLVDLEVLEDIAAFSRQSGLPDLIYGDIEVRSVRGTRSVFRPPAPEAALEFMICGCLPHQATFAHRRLFQRIGGFNERYKVQADYDWFLRALTADGVSIRHVDRVVASFALGGASSGLRRGQEETYAIQNALDFYNQPEWVLKRLHAFQRQTLEHRLRLQEVEGAFPDWPMRVLRKVLGPFRQ